MVLWTVMRKGKAEGSSTLRLSFWWPQWRQRSLSARSRLPARSSPSCSNLVLLGLSHDLSYLWRTMNIWETYGPIQALPILIYKGDSDYKWSILTHTYQESHTHTSFPTWSWLGHFSLWIWCWTAQSQFCWSQAHTPELSTQNQAAWKSPAASSGWLQHPRKQNEKTKQNNMQNHYQWNILTVFKDTWKWKWKKKWTYLLGFVGHYLKFHKNL